MAARVDAGDDLLTDVAALGVADVGGFQPGFERDHALIHVDSVARDAGFDSQDFSGFLSYWDDPVLQPTLIARWSLICRQVDIKPTFASVIRGDYRSRIAHLLANQPLFDKR